MIVNLNRITVVNSFGSFKKLRLNLSIYATFPFSAVVWVDAFQFNNIIKNYDIEHMIPNTIDTRWYVFQDPQPDKNTIPFLIQNAVLKCYTEYVEMEILTFLPQGSFVSCLLMLR